MSVTLKQIAELAKVSVSSVSQILNDKPSNFCSEETRARVRKIAEELGYRRNFGYSLMRGLSTQTVAILAALPRLTEHEPHRDLIMTLIRKFDIDRIGCYVNSLGLDSKENMLKIQDLLDRGCGSFIFLGIPVHCRELLSAIGQSGASYLLSAGGTGFEREIIQDTEYGADQIFRFFQRSVKDHFRLFMINMRMENNPRITALAKLYPDLPSAEIGRRFVLRGIVDTPDIEELPALSIEYARKNIVRIMERHPEVKAMAFTNDQIALAAAGSLLRAGYRIGKDILLAGYNNSSAVQTFPFPITSARVSSEELSEIIRREAFSKTPCRIVIKPDIFIRNLR